MQGDPMFGGGSALNKELLLNFDEIVLESNEIDSAIYSALTNNDLVNTAQIYNLMVAKKN
jgi:uncharacterized protein YdcH (DUF465 family)